MSLVAICGNRYGYNMGNLKTLTMTWLNVQDAAIEIPIYANYHLNPMYIDYTHLHDIYDIVREMKECDIGTFSIDEMSTIFDCYGRPSDKDGTKALNNIAKQTRKLKIKCRYTAQYFGQVNNSLRSLTTTVLVTQKYHKTEFGFDPCYDDYCYKQHYLGIQKFAPDEKGLYPISEELFYFIPDILFSVYDTAELINNECKID